MSELKFSSDSKWREFQGKQYLNCDDYTDEEMEVVANWHDAPKEKRVAFCDKYGFNSPPGLFYSGSTIRTVYVHVRLADVKRTLQWREVKAESLSNAIKVAEQMPDVEICLEASFVPGGVPT